MRTSGQTQQRLLPLEHDDQAVQALRIRSDHKALRDQLARVEGGEGALFDELSILGGLLHEHFGREERAPIYANLPLDTPRLAERLGELLDEHRRIRNRVVELQAAALTGNPELPHMLADFVRELRRHEREEEDILQGAVLQDLGTGD